MNNKTSGASGALFQPSSVVAGRLAACYGISILTASLPKIALPADVLNQPVSIEISPDTPLDQALVRWSVETGVQVMMNTDTLKKEKTRGVRGTQSASGALETLLKGSGLSYSLNANTVYITPARYNSGAEVGVSTTTDSPKKKPADVATQEPRQSEVEEVVVTAQKRQERLLDTPVSVSVLSGDELNKLAATQLRDWANTVPGLDFTTAGSGYSQIAIRGVTTGLASNPTVGIYLDEIPIGSSSAFAYGARLSLDAGLFDVNHIEVLRGPQGTLYGASTMGGLIKYVSKTPDPTHFSVDLQSGVSNTQGGGISYTGAIVMNAPLISDKAAVRGSMFYSRDGGYIDNAALDQRNVNRSATYGGRLDVSLTPIEYLTVRIGGMIQNITRDGQSTADYTLQGQPLNGSLNQSRLYPEPFHQQFRLVDATIGYDLGFATLNSFSSYQTNRTQDFFDISSLLVPIYNGIPGFGPFSAIGLPVDTSTDKFTEEVRFASKGATSLEWMVAGFYTHETSLDHEAFLTRDSAGAAGVPGALYDIFNPTTYDEYAAFGNLTYHFTSAFDITGGARYARNHQVYSETGTSIAPVQVSTQGVVTYLGDARYHFSDHATGYLRYSTGYRPGGPNYYPFPGLQTFQPDTLKSYEAGIKAETADQRFGLDFAAYYIDWKNIQVITARDGQGVVVNAPGGAKIDGAELSLTGRPISKLSFSGAFAYQNARLARADADIGGLADERLPNVPRFTMALNSDYRFSDAAPRPTVGATLRYVSSRNSFFSEDPAQPQYRLPQYTTVDLRGGFTVDNVDVQLYLHNLADKRAQLSAFTAYASAGGPAQVSILQPRTVGISLTAHF